MSDWLHRAPARHEHEAKRNANEHRDKLEFEKLQAVRGQDDISCWELAHKQLNVGLGA